MRKYQVPPEGRATRTTGVKEALVKVSYVNSDRHEAVVWRRREFTGMSEHDVDDVAFLTGTCVQALHRQARVWPLSAPGCGLQRVPTSSRGSELGARVRVSVTASPPLRVIWMGIDYYSGSVP